MFRKIITYLLIIAVVSPLIISAVFSVGVKKAYADYTYTNTLGYKVTRTSKVMGDGELTQYEESYTDNNGNTYNITGTQKKAGEISWGQATKNGQSGDYSAESSFAEGDGATNDSSGSNSSSGGNADSSGSSSSVAEVSNTGEVKSPCSIWAGKLFSADCLFYGITNFLFYIFYRTTNYVTYLAGNIFNASIGFSINGRAFDTGENSMLGTGWTLIRDMMNLFFIFILLYTAISTILQYGSVAKNAIVTIIIAAVLINFSLMMTKMIIDASHILSWEFYNRIDVTNTAKKGDGLSFPEIASDLKVKGRDSDFEMKDLSGAFMAGFNVQRIMGESDATKDNLEETINNVQKNGGNIRATYWQMIIIILLSSVINLIAAFILFAGAILFVIRVAVLWFVIMFSPFAFAGMIFPGFKSYSGKWWDYLINQAFFAPAFLFMFYLVVELINSNFLQKMLSVANNAPTAKILFLNAGGTIVVVFHFIIIGTLMVMCLVLAKSMGAVGASTMTKWGNKAGDWARNTIGDRAAWRGTRYGLRYGGGALADKTLDEEKGWGKKGWAKTLRAIPGVGIGLRSLGVMKKADEDKARKAAEKYAGTLSKEGLASLNRDIKDKSFAQRFLHTGSEGAFAPGKEGYQNIIAKKKSEEDEKIKYRKKLAELASYKDDRDSSGNIIKGGSKEDKVKRMLDKGQRKELDEEIENITKKITDAYKKAAEVIEDRITTTAVDLTEKNSRLYKAIEDGEPVSVIEAIKRDIINLEKDKNKFNGQKTVMEKKKKEREDKEKAVEKYEAKQDTEKLGAKFSSSGAGGAGGGGKGSGGGKTTP